MPNLVSTYTTPLTPEEEYLLSLEAVAAEPVPPPPADGYNGGGTYNPYADPAYVPPPPVETAPAPAPVVTENYGTPQAGGGDPFAAYQPPPEQRTDIDSTPASPYMTDTPVVPLPGPPVSPNTDIYQLGQPTAWTGGPGVASRVNDNRAPTPYQPADASLTDTRSLNERVAQETPFRGIQQAPYVPPPQPWAYDPGMYQDRYPGYATESNASLPDVFNIPTDTEGVSWGSVFDPATWLPEPQRVYDENGNEVVGYGEGAFLAGPPIVSSRARAKGLRTSPASAGPAISPRTRPPSWVPPEPAPVAPAETVPPPPSAGPQTFPRLAGKPGTPAGGGGIWGPNGEIIYPRQPSAVTEPVIALPSETIPPPPAAPTLSARAQAALDEAAAYNSAAGIAERQRAANTRRVQSAFRPGAETGRQSARRARPAPTESSGTGRPADAPEPAPPPEAAPAPVVAPARGAKWPLSRRATILLGAGAVGGSIAAANSLGGREDAPAVAPPLPSGVTPFNPATVGDINTLMGSTAALTAFHGNRPDTFNPLVEKAPVEDANGVVREGVRIRGRQNPDGTSIFVGYMDANGQYVPAGSDVTAEDYQAMLAENGKDWAGAPLSETGATDTATGTGGTGGTATGATGGTTTGTTLQDVSIPAPSGTGGGSSRSSGGGGSTRSSGGGRSSGRDYGGGDSFSRGYEREFTADDFMEQAGGNRRKAEFMAKAANRRRRRGKSGGFSGGMGGFWEGFPFNRPPSDIRTLVLNAIAESQAEGRARKQQRG